MPAAGCVFFADLKKRRIFDFALIASVTTAGRKRASSRKPVQRRRLTIDAE
jgi:hypothetical protein